MPTQPELSTHSARSFVDKYKSARSEKQLAESFWRDFLIDVINVDDLLSAGVEFQAPVKSATTGNINFIDVFWPRVLLIEHKSAGKSLDKAEEQAREYLVSLEASKRPPVFIVSDFKRIRIVEVFAGTTVEFPLEELPKNLHRFESLFEGYIAHATRVEASADSQAATLMANLFVEIEKTGIDEHKVSVFLVRILFLLFGDDARLWKRGLFESLIEMTPTLGIGGLLEQLFQVVNTPREKRPSNLDSALNDFPYINGGLFEEPLPVFSFSSEMRDALVKANKYDWSQISPAIFGAMFQTIKDKDARRELGEHYTSEANILKVIGPLFLNDFNERLQKAWDSPGQLRRFHKELSTYTFADPAAGCGNFLILSYKRLRELDLKLIARLQEIEGTQAYVGLDGTWGVNIRLSQFHGIEYEEWSSEIARVAMFLTEHQANLALEEITGSAPSLLPLGESAQITHGNALRLDWSELWPMTEKTFIFGNPPFSGYSYQNKEQREDTEVVWGGIPSGGVVDYVANWYLVSARHLSQSGGRAAFVSTNSITQGEQPAIIWGQLNDLGLEIDFAHRTFSWENDAPGKAAVHCVIIGFSNRAKPAKRELWSYETAKSRPSLNLVKNINGYLLDAPNVLITARSKPLSSHTQPMDYGSKPTDGGFLSNIDETTVERILKTDPIASKYLRRLIGAQELIHNDIRWCLWLRGAEPSDIRNSIELAARVDAVRKLREASPKKTTQRDAERPSEFQEIRQPTSDYLAIPRVSSEERDYVPIARFGVDIITNDSVFIIADASLTTFGVLNSRPFNVWNKAVSGRLESRTRISNTITYNNFPFPDLLDVKKKDLEKAAQGILDARKAHPTQSLASLYDKNSMPTELRVAHKVLDKEVLLALGLKPDASDEAILEKLFDLYTQATADLFTPLHPPTRKKKK